MRRFYCPDADLTQENIEITSQKEIHHLKNVLRFKPLDQIRIFNRRGQEIAATILKLENNRMVARKDSAMIQPAKKSAVVKLACAIPKKAKFEFIIEKATELDVAVIVPLLTHRTEISLDASRSAKKKERYQTVAINAAKQCGRADIPDIRDIQTFPEFLKSIDPNSLNLIPCLDGPRKDLFETLQNADASSEITVIIGPEGDFTDEELKLALKSGCIPVSLGPTVLKVDTAALTAVSWIHLYLEHASKPK